MDDEIQTPQDGETTEAEVTEPTTDEEAADGKPAAPAAAAADEPTPADDRPAWVKALDEAPADELRKHPKFAGHLGSAIEERRARWEAEHTARLQERADAEARQRAEDELEELARDNPIAFSERFLTDRDRHKAQSQLQQIRSSTQADLTRAVGAAFRDIPEWAELTAEDHEHFFKALAGVPDEKVVGVFNATALERVAAVKARKIHDDWKAKELAKEREALRTEVTAELMQNGGRPGIGRVRGAGQIDDEPDFIARPAEWQDWYDRTELARNR